MSDSNVVNLRSDRPRVQSAPVRYMPPKLMDPKRASALKTGLDFLAKVAGKTPEQYRDDITPNHRAIFREDTSNAIEALGADRTIKILEDCLSFAKSQRG